MLREEMLRGEGTGFASDFEVVWQTLRGRY